MRLHLLIVVGFLLSLGCGSAQFEPRDAKSKNARSPEPAAAGERGPAKDGEALASRKIIYTARAELIVEDFDQGQKALLQLVEQHKGYVAGSEVSGAPGTRRFGTWTVRVPETGFRSFLTALESLGEPRRNTTDSQDVTDEYYDLEARIKNKQVEEERLLEHLKKSTGKLEDILAVERELSRVRGEIEQAQGRFQKLTKLTELTTVTITLQERKDYVPDASPSFGTTLGRTFEGSVDVLVGLGKGLVLAVVALVPWIPLLAVVGSSVWWLVRRRSPRGPRTPPLEALPASPPPAPGAA